MDIQNRNSNVRKYLKDIHNRLFKCITTKNQLNTKGVLKEMKDNKVIAYRKQAAKWCKLFLLVITLKV